ncbi:PucR family transcriptional regulator [Bacillus solimangrovi]|uniref:PucR family transcriptional regulator n=1 Tax=Bacillus solimangrovi TaxID=1305675 RepID=A0A1E5LGD3_9BACI|nr:helix-turn-helix domain-containing protein [Bacillus solimangrovi]OEH93133.1 hypothetical protein BFG57_13355 [Bacillus solimangrovi]
MKGASIERVLNTQDINEVAEIISVFLQKPVIIENKNFELIAYSSTYNYHFDPTQQKTILSKRCPLFIVDILKKEGIVNQLQTKPDPIRVSPIEEVGLYQRIVIGAKYENQTMGYIWVQESNELLSEEELDFLKGVSQHVGKLIFEAIEKKKEKIHKKDNLLWKIINHEYQSEQFLKREADDVNLVLPEAFSVVVISLRHTNSKVTFENMKEIVHSLVGRLGKATYWLDEEPRITIIIGKSELERYSPRELSNEFITNFKNMVGKEEEDAFLYGIGNQYNDLTCLRKSYLEALEVINTAEFMEYDREHISYEYSKLGIYRYVTTIFEKNMAEGFINQNLVILKNHDDKNQSQLMKTLKAYLANNCKLKQTAEQLFIHPNTLNYRIKQIKQLIAIDFEDFNQKCQLFIDLTLYDNMSDYRKSY